MSEETLNELEEEGEYRIPEHLPSRAEIEEETRKIREDWSEAEHRRRARKEAGAMRIETQEIKASDLFGPQ